MKSKLYENKNVILLGGATASGKSDLAYDLAKELDGEIVNADSMQIYKNFPILTSQPDSDSKKKIKHHLYGYVETNKNYTSAAWLKDCLNVLVNIRKKDKIPIVVGGTGLYLEFLFKGISIIPDIPKNIRNQVENEIFSNGLGSAYKKLKNIDYKYTKKINNNDKQRIARSLEVFYHTGKNLSFYHNKRRKKSNFRFIKVLLMPEKKIIKENCEKRFLKMLEMGLIKEIKNNNIKVNNCNIKNAIGFKEINAYLEKKISLSKATEISIKKTKDYSKRQCTWFNNRYDPLIMLSSIKNTSLVLETLEKIN